MPSVPCGCPVSGQPGGRLTPNRGTWSSDVDTQVPNTTCSRSDAPSRAAGHEEEVVPPNRPRHPVKGDRRGSLEHDHHDIHGAVDVLTDGAAWPQGDEVDIQLAFPAQGPHHAARSPQWLDEVEADTADATMLARSFDQPTALLADLIDPAGPVTPLV